MGSVSDYFLRPADYLIVVVLLVLGFVLREFVFRASGSLWADIRHLFDIEIPTEADRVVPAPGSGVNPIKRPTCTRCGSAIPFGSSQCDTCERLGIPPVPSEPAWQQPESVPSVEFASWATWTVPRTVPHHALGPAVLRLKIAMLAALATGVANLVLSGFAVPGWFHSFLIVAGFACFVLPFWIKRKSIIALGTAASLTVALATHELLNPEVAYAVLIFRGLALLCLVQPFGPALRLKREETQRAQLESRRAA